MSQETWTMKIHNLLPSVTNNQPFQEHIPNRTLPTQRALSWEIWKVSVQSLTIPDSHWVACHFKITSSITLPTEKALHPKEPEKWPYSLFPHVTDKWPFQDHLPNKSTESRCSVPGDLNSDSRVSSPYVNTEWSSVSWCLLSTTLLTQSALCIWRRDQWQCRVYLQCPAISIFSLVCLYWLKELCVQEDLNNDCVLSLQVHSRVSCHLKIMFLV